MKRLLIYEVPALKATYSVVEKGFAGTRIGENAGAGENDDQDQEWFDNWDWDANEPVEWE